MEELTEDAIEDRKVFVAMNEQRPQGVVHLVANSEIDLRQRFEGVEHATGVDIEASGAQPAAECKQILVQIIAPHQR